MNIIEVYTDGACEPVNPGGYAAYGVYIRELHGDGTYEELFKASRLFVPEKGKERQTSNNVAEYSGILCALEWLIANDRHKEMIEFYSDSKLVICQLFGDELRGGYKWRMLGGFYMPIAIKAEKLLAKLPRAFGHWIPREENTLADELSKEELIKAGIRFRIQPREDH